MRSVRRRSPRGVIADQVDVVDGPVAEGFEDGQSFSPAEVEYSTPDTP